jgi:hypothetical protein
MGSVEYFPGCKPEPEIDRQQRLREERAQEIFYMELLNFVSRLQDVYCMTEAVKDELENLLHAIHEHAPTRLMWNKKIGVK